MEPRITPSIESRRVLLGQGRPSIASHLVQPVRPQPMASLLPFLLRLPGTVAEENAHPFCSRGVGGHDGPLDPGLVWPHPGRSVRRLWRSPGLAWAATTRQPCSSSWIHVRVYRSRAANGVPANVLSSAPRNHVTPVRPSTSTVRSSSMTFVRTCWCERCRWSRPCSVSHLPCALDHRGLFP
jgi:hypothetical protein